MSNGIKRVKIPKGWRRLQVGEVLCREDRYQSLARNAWVPTANEGLVVRPDTDFIYIRKKSSDAAYLPAKIIAEEEVEEVLHEIADEIVRFHSADIASLPRRSQLRKLLSLLAKHPHNGFKSLKEAGDYQFREMYDASAGTMLHWLGRENS